MSSLRWPVVVAFAAVALCNAHHASAQESPSVTAPLAPAPFTKEQIENRPARELKFEESSESFRRPLNNPLPALAEQKFVAVLPFVVPPGVERERSAMERDSKVYDLQYIGGTYFLAPTPFSRTLLSEELSRVIDHVPEQLLSKAERDYFRSAEVDLGFVMLSNNVLETARQQNRDRDRERRPSGDAAKDIKTVQIFWTLGKTVAQCEQRSRSLVTILDQGFCRPLQLELLQLRSEQAESFAKTQQEYNKLQERIPVWQKSLEEYADLSNDMLTGLRLQQREAEIKLAGANARLAAIGKTDKLRGLPLEQARFTAEIEIADLEAQQAKALELVAKVSKRIDLTSSIEWAEKAAPNQYSSLHFRLRRVQQLDRDLLRHAPLPLVDGKITIRPVEWTTP